MKLAAVLLALHAVAALCFALASSTEIIHHGATTTAIVEITAAMLNGLAAALWTTRLERR